jgi:hypothetical protein
VLSFFVILMAAKNLAFSRNEADSRTGSIYYYRERKMSDELKKKAASIANSSGFPLQIKIANAANSTNWKVLLQEHPWHSSETGAEGFLDIVLNKPGRFNRDIMVIECKRVRDAKWIFLIPKLQPSHRYHACLWESKYIEGKWIKFGWEDWVADPASYESQFCAMPGHEHGRRTLLERTAAELIEATEALALQEKRLAPKGSDLRRLYIPVIVTTAELIVSYFEPEFISLKDGSLPNNSLFENISYIRFRKSLTTKISSDANDIKEMHIMTERTVFVVNAEKINEFINSWRFRRE